MGKKHFTEKNKERICTVIRLVKNLREAQAKLKKMSINISIPTLRRMRARSKKSGGLKRKKGSGRPRKTSRFEDISLVKIAKRNRQISSQELTERFNNRNNKEVSRSTVSRRLKTRGYTRRPAISKPFLTDGQKARRLDFAQLHLNKPLAFWKRVKFSDEKIFAMDSSSRQVLVTRRPDERHEPSCTVRRTKSGPQVHVWAIISATKVGPIRQIQGTLNPQRYIENIIPDIQEMLLLRGPGRAKRGIFQQDNAPAHRARVTQQFLQANNIQVLEWPGNAPDISPIENVWGHVARRVRLRGRPRNNNELFHWVEEEWRATPKPYLASLYRSMKSRLSEVIRNNGDATSY